MSLELILFFLQLGFIFIAIFAAAFGPFARVEMWASAAALASVVASITIRSIEAGRPPFASMYEFGLLLCFLIDAFLLFTVIRFKERVFALSVAGSAFVAGSVIVMFFEKARPLVPALKSVWLGAHVVTAVVAYGCLAVSAAYAVASFVPRIGPETVARMERSMSRLISVAFPFLTLLIITGAVWAEYAWGSFWRWDPKETWALITWIAYLGYLHVVRSRGWKGRRAAKLAIVCFAIVLFTFFGVNLLLAGLHSYA